MQVVGTNAELTSARWWSRGEGGIELPTDNCAYCNAPPTLDYKKIHSSTDDRLICVSYQILNSLYPSSRFYTNVNFEKKMFKKCYNSRGIRSNCEQYVFNNMVLVTQLWNWHRWVKNRKSGKENRWERTSKQQKGKGKKNNEINGVWLPCRKKYAHNKWMNFRVIHKIIEVILLSNFILSPFTLANSNLDAQNFPRFQ